MRRSGRGVEGTDQCLRRHCRRDFQEASGKFRMAHGNARRAEAAGLPHPHRGRDPRLEHVVFDWNRDSQKGRFLIQTPCWARGPAWMTRPYSEDIRERALARADAGETVRSIAEALQISPSCVTKWKNLRRDTGGLSPGKIGGHKKRVLSDANADWLRKRIRSGPFTLRKLTQDLAERGIKTFLRAVWTFVHTEGLSFKKNDPSHRTRPPRRRP